MQLKGVSPILAQPVYRPKWAVLIYSHATV